MKKIENILPCVCSVPVDYIDSCRNGMPHMAMSYSWSGKSFFSCFCPKCGRGTTLASEKSPYYAIKKWNEVQRICYAIAGVDENNLEVDYEEKYGKIMDEVEE